MGDQVTAERQVWDRQPGETSWEFARFRRYRDQGPARSVANAARVWLADERPVRIQQRRYREVLASGGDSERYVRRVTHTWDEASSKWGWVARAQAFDEAVDEEARGKAILAHVEEEAEQLRLRLVAARTLRSRGLAVWERFGALVDEGKLAEMFIEKMKQVLVEPQEGSKQSRVEREIPSILSQLGLATSAIVEGLKQERLELGEVTDRTVIEGLGALAGESSDRLRRGRARLRELIGDDDPDES